MDIQGDFVPNFDPKRPPQKPEPFYYDYEFRLEEECPSCKLQFGIHFEDEICECMLKEIRRELRN